jgi:hypothetical protein
VSRFRAVTNGVQAFASKSRMSASESFASVWPDHGDFRSTPVNGHSQDRRACLKVPIGDKGMLGRLMSPMGSRENSDVQLAAACKGTASIKCVPLVDFGLVNSAPS